MRLSSVLLLLTGLTATQCRKCADCTKKLDVRKTSADPLIAKPMCDAYNIMISCLKKHRCQVHELIKGYTNVQKTCLEYERPTDSTGLVQQSFILVSLGLMTNVIAW